MRYHNRRWHEIAHALRLLTTYPVRSTPIAITISNPDVFTAVSCGTSVVSALTVSTGVDNTVCAGVEACVGFGVGEDFDNSA